MSKKKRDKQNQKTGTDSLLSREVHKTLSPLSSEYETRFVMFPHNFFSAYPLKSYFDKVVRRTALFFFVFLERFFHIKIFIEVPEELRDINPKVWSLGRIAGLLQHGGFLSYVRHLPGFNNEPSLYMYEAVSTSENSTRTSTGVGTSFTDEKEAFGAALGEMIERYCYYNFRPEIPKITSYESMGDQALDPKTFAGIDLSLRKNPQMPYLHVFDKKTSFQWIKGYSLMQKKEIWVPHQVISGNKSVLEDLLKSEPMIRPFITTGLAVGTSKEETLYNGLCEVIERDAYMITYLNRISPPHIAISEFPGEEFAFIERQLKKYNLKTILLRLPTDVPCHVIMAIITPNEKSFGPYFSMGMKADLDLERATYGALKEAMRMRIEARFLLESNKGKKVPRPEEVDKINQFERVLLWQSTSEFLPHIEFLWKGPRQDLRSIPKFSLSDGSSKEKLTFLVDYFREHEMEVSYVDMMAPIFKDFFKRKLTPPFYSLFVVVPALQPLHVRESVPSFGGIRIKEVPKKLGITVDASINTFPHPFP